MNAKILLVDDERDIVEFLQYNLLQEGFHVITAYDGEEALQKVINLPDLIVLDIMMPKLDGFEVFRRLRKLPGYEHTPVLFLTAKTQEIDEIMALDMGAIDYIHKPITPKKFIARIKSNLRKAAILNGSYIPQRVKNGPLEIDKDEYTVFIDGIEKVFPRKEFEVLYYLANHAGKVISRDNLLKDVWGTDVFVVDRTIDVHIRKIREKLDRHADMIETVKGVGYRFKSVE